MRNVRWLLSLVIVVAAISANAQAPRETVIPTPARVTSASLAATADRIAAVCADHKLRIWDIAASRLLQTIALGDTPIDMLTLSRDGRWVFAGDHVGGMNVWSADTGATRIQLHLPHYPGAAVFSRDGRLFALAPAGDPVQVFDLRSAKKLFETPSVIGGAAALAFSRDGSSLASADADTVVRIYDTQTGKLRARSAEFLNEPLAIDFTPDGKQVVAGGGDKFVAFFDASTGKRVRVSEKVAEPVAYLEFTPDGKSLAAVLMKADNMAEPAPLVIWDATSGAKVREWLAPSLPITGGFGSAGEIIAVTVTPEALHILKP